MSVIYDDTYNITPYHHKEKLIIGLNYADKIEPLSRYSPFSPNSEQKHDLKMKAESISRIFNISRKKIVCYSARDGYNMNKLNSRIMNIIKCGNK